MPGGPENRASCRSSSRPSESGGGILAMHQSAACLVRSELQGPWINSSRSGTNLSLSSRSWKEMVALYSDRRSQRTQEQLWQITYNTIKAFEHEYILYPQSAHFCPLKMFFVAFASLSPAEPLVQLSARRGTGKWGARVKSICQQCQHQERRKKLFCAFSQSFRKKR